MYCVYWLERIIGRTPNIYMGLPGLRQDYSIRVLFTHTEARIKYLSYNP
jgi:hypothetical protein